MRIVSELPQDRRVEGQLSAYAADGTRLYGPVRCCGEADDAAAVRAGNREEDPARPFGDHPYGLYAIVAVERDKLPARSYGPAFLRLDPVDSLAGGEARSGELAGRAGLGIHGGDLGPDDTLRPTFGCLRLGNPATAALAALVEEALHRREPVEYECRPPAGEWQ